MQKKRQKTNKVESREKLGIRSIEKVLQELKKELKNIYGKRLKKLILYGSYARTEAWKDSDIDVVVLLNGEGITRKGNRQDD